MTSSRILVQIAPSPLSSGRHIIKLGIAAKDAWIHETPWNLVFLVDVSGAMHAPNKLPLVQQSLKVLIKSMKPSDKVAILTYAGSATTVVESTGIKVRSKILAEIDRLKA